ncbi:acetylcholinesterase-like [Ptychodera flava]|uniref:acetylcholinesterase-like n=1 Tax=Ptychodera flava TaxID=63121 RepID=UPI00396A2E3F
MEFTSLFLALWGFLGLSIGHEWPIIQRTKFGDIRGKRKVLRAIGHQVDAFLGIPYAERPVRFKRAQLWRESWDGVRDATEFSNNCWQPPLSDDFPGLIWQFATENLSEDCLYLNIWTPYPRQNDSAAVMVWIHGGTFVWGSANVHEYEGQILAATQQVVVVTINYRLGPFGFLSLGIPEVPGNLGLLDQVIALQWIRENIEYFGGNPELVTIFGSSAGGAAVGYHLLSPQSRSLFRRAILQSGSPNTSALRPLSNELRDELTTPYLKSIGCLPDEDAKDSVVRCLREMPAYNLTFDPNFFAVHFPVVDGTFLQSDVDTMLAKSDFKDTEIMLGNVANEWFINLVLSRVTGFSTLTESLIDNVEYYEAIRVSLGGLLSPGESLTDTVSFLYRDWKDPGNRVKMRDAAEDALGDLRMKCPVIEFANVYLSANKSVYYYSLNRRSSLNPWPQWMGTVHGEEIIYIFGHQFTVGNSEYDEEEAAFSVRMMEHWANFAKYGNPNEVTADGNPVDSWPKYEAHEKKYIIFDNTTGSKPTIGSHPRTPYCEFWRDLVPKLQRSMCVENDTKVRDCMTETTTRTTSSSSMVVASSVLVTSLLFAFRCLECLV